MGTFKVFSISALVAIAAAVLFLLYNRNTDHQLPNLKDKWWALGPKTDEPSVVSRMKIDVPDNEIKDLYQRLRNTKPFHPSLEGVNQFYGTHTTLLNNVLDYWLTQYNWTERQTYLNQYPHFHTKIGGLKIHFVHVKPQSTVNENGDNVEVVPLLMVHGWPGSFREFYEIIPLLTVPQNRNFVFELIIPSLPGFGYSQASSKPGLSGAYMGQIFADLMLILGHKQFYVQGGDWGSSIVQNMAVFYPERIRGLHSNMCYCNTPWNNFKLYMGRFLPSLIYENEDEQKLCESPGNQFRFLVEESGYFHLQSTKPDTIGVALRDSPMGLAAYMLEKFSTLTNPEYRNRQDGGLTEKFTMDQLLDNVMIYYVTGAMTSAMRIYAEVFANAYIELQTFHMQKIQVPTGCSRFPNEILLTPRSILQSRFQNLVHLTLHKRGGHFAALEEPRLLANDVLAFVDTVRRFK